LSFIGFVRVLGLVVIFHRLYYLLLDTAISAPRYLATRRSKMLTMLLGSRTTLVLGSELRSSGSGRH
jgi:hypothetical protein